MRLSGNLYKFNQLCRLHQTLFPVTFRAYQQRRMSTIKPDTQLMHKLLDEYSTKRWFIEYAGSFQNHISQAIISMIQLGATEPMVRSFVKEYEKRLEEPENFVNDLDPNVQLGEDLVELFGRRKGYYVLKEYYGKKAENKDLSSMIGEFYPRLCTGMIGAAAHALIYLGYGFSAQSRTTVIEGLAYSHYGAMPLETERDLEDQKLGRGPYNILQALEAVRKSSLKEWMLMKIQQAPWDTFNTSFQRKAAVLMSCKADDLLNFVYQITFPKSLLPESNVSVQERGTVIGSWLVDAAITVYTIAEVKNDFFLLHGVTASWALKQLLPCLKTHEDVTKATTVFLTALVAVYIVQNCQELNPKLLETNEALATWEDIIQRTLQPQKDDEHIYKLVQVCYDMSQLSPDDKNKQKLYTLAAERALHNHLHL